VLNENLEPELNRLSREVVALGEIVEAAILESVDVLQRRVSPVVHSRPASSDPLITLDHQITKKRFAIEMDCMALIVAHQPVDGDLRSITSMLEIVTELEHIGHYIADIARIHFLLAKIEEPLTELLSDVQRMANSSQDMLRRALLAFERQDATLARAVHLDDDEVDEAYRQFYGEVLTFMKGRSRTTIKQARYLAQISRNLERSADRVTNICEWVAFAVTGKMNTIEQGTVDMLQEEMA
jgi:phosphate transport system protein